MTKHKQGEALPNDRHPGTTLSESNSENERRHIIDPNKGPKRERK